MKCYAYIRVSTIEQDENIQMKSITDFCTTNGYEILDFFIDKGESGAKPFAERPSSRAMLEKLKITPVDAIVVWSIDRIGRSMMDTLTTIMKLEESGIKVISVKEEWLRNLEPNTRKLILSILSWFAEFERQRIRERQELAWKSGKTKGRPRKIPEHIVLKYLKKYDNIKLKTIQKIMNADGYQISYSTLRRYVKQIKKKP